jgi:hypothetical protein
MDATQAAKQFPSSASQMVCLIGVMFSVSR